MTCSEFEQILPEIIEGGGSAAQQAHLKSCPACSGLVAELNALAAQARLLSAAEEPSPRLWNAIRNSLEEEGLIRHTRRRDNLLPFLTPGNWRPAAWLVPVAAALLVAVGLLLRTPGPSSPEVAQKTAPAVVRQPSVKTSGTAADRDDQQLLAEVAARTPSLRVAYEDNLKHVNDYIQDAEQSVQQNPEDEDARHSLRDAYEQKAVLYEMAMNNSLP